MGAVDYKGRVNTHYVWPNQLSIEMSRAISDTWARDGLRGHYVPIFSYWKNYTSISLPINSLCPGHLYLYQSRGVRRTICTPHVGKPAPRPVKLILVSYAFTNSTSKGFDGFVVQ